MYIKETGIENRKTLASPSHNYYLQKKQKNKKGEEIEMKI